MSEVCMVMVGCSHARDCQVGPEHGIGVEVCSKVTWMQWDM